jgi:ribosomal 50S subunit-recycling heat shock protein
MCFAITCKTHFLQENDMRIDKFLKNSRLIKRRTVAKDACDQGRVFINDKVAKAGSEVNVGDTIHIEFGNSSVTVRVMDIIESARKETAPQMYEIIQ